MPPPLPLANTSQAPPADPVEDAPGRRRISRSPATHAAAITRLQHHRGRAYASYAEFREGGLSPWGMVRFTFPATPFFGRVGFTVARPVCAPQMRAAPGHVRPALILSTKGHGGVRCYPRLVAASGNGSPTRWSLPPARCRIRGCRSARRTAFCARPTNAPPSMISCPAGMVATNMLPSSRHGVLAATPRGLEWRFPPRPRDVHPRHRLRRSALQCAASGGPGQLPCWPVTDGPVPAISVGVCPPAQCSATVAALAPHTAPSTGGALVFFLFELQTHPRVPALEGLSAR